MTRMNAHNRKRAERFAAQGIGAEDLRYAVASYAGAEDASCALCDHAILYNFHLSFVGRGERGPNVAFQPVGSKCILDWFKALPDSPDRAAAIAKVKDAEKEMRRQKKVMGAFFDADDADGANLMRIFFLLPPEVQNAGSDDPLSDIGTRVAKYLSFSSDGQRRYFAGLVRSAARERGINTRPPRARNDAPASSDAPDASTPATPASRTDGFNAADYEDEDTARLAYLYLQLDDDHRTDTVEDIGERLLRFRRFASDKQRGFFAWKLKDAARAQGLNLRPTLPPPSATATASSDRPAPRADLPPPPPAEVEETRYAEPVSFLADADSDSDDYEDPF